MAWLLRFALLLLFAGLVQPLGLRFTTHGTYDEALFLRLAQHLASGQWLGPYDQLTLVKGVGFPLWLAAMHHLGVPVIAGAAALYAAACGLSSLALRPLLPDQRLRLLIFALLLLAPTSLADFSLMRELIYPALVLLLVACVGGWCLRWRDRGVWRWALASGLAVAAVVLTREEGVWLLPLAVPLMMLAVRGLRLGGSVRRQVLAACVLALAGACGPWLLVATTHQATYGVFTGLELNTRPFTAAYGALQRIRHGSVPPQVAVAREAWTRAAAESPAFASTAQALDHPARRANLGPGIGVVGPLLAVNPALREWVSAQIGYSLPSTFPGGTASPWLREAYSRDPAFRERFDRYLGGPAMARGFLSGAMDTEFAAARFVWMLRDAAAEAGHHRSATAAAAYYAQVATEIDRACDEGRLSCDAPRVGLRPPFTPERRERVLPALLTAAQALLSLESHSSAWRTGDQGLAAELAVAGQFLNEVLPPSHQSIPASPGWEALITTWRVLLPPLVLMALLPWLWTTAAMVRRSRRRSGTPREQMLWLAAAVMLALVLLRLALLAVIHATSWPAATLVRYLAPAHPPLLLFIGLSLALAWERWRRPDPR